jgi:hypothetical protein
MAVHRQGRYAVATSVRTALHLSDLGGTRHARSGVYDATLYHEHDYHMYLNWYHNFLATRRDSAERPWQSSVRAAALRAEPDRFCLLAAGRVPALSQLRTRVRCARASTIFCRALSRYQDMFCGSYALIRSDCPERSARGTGRPRFSSSVSCTRAVCGPAAMCQLYERYDRQGLCGARRIELGILVQSFLKYGFRHTGAAV